MQDITELQRRLASALDRIGSGLESAGRAPVASADGSAGDAQALMDELEAERTLTAQLEERLRSSRERSDHRVGEVEAELVRCQASLAKMEDDRNRLKAGNEALREALRGLRETGGAGKAADAAMQTEFDAMRQARASDRVELDAVIAMLGEALDGKKERDHA